MDFIAFSYANFDTGGAKVAKKCQWRERYMLRFSYLMAIFLATRTGVPFAMFVGGQGG